MLVFEKPSPASFSIGLKNIVKNAKKIKTPLFLMFFHIFKNYLARKQIWGGVFFITLIDRTEINLKHI